MSDNAASPPPSEDSMSDLLPCPFCGAEPFRPVPGPTGGSVIECMRCHAEVGHATRTDAIAAWNRRASPPAGWRLVPVDPTEAMIEAGWIDKEDVSPKEIYAAMLDASPPPPETGNG